MTSTGPPHSWAMYLGSNVTLSPSALHKAGEFGAACKEWEKILKRFPDAQLADQVRAQLEADRRADRARRAYDRLMQSPAGD